MTASQYEGGPAPPRKGAATSETGCSPSAPIEPNPTRRRHVAAVLGVWHPPTGRRRLGLIYVPVCQLCGGAHTHRAATRAATYTRSPSCQPAAEYEVVVTVLHPAELVVEPRPLEAIG
jgi:hypothetical protein